MLDAASLAIKAALFDAKFQNLTVQAAEFGQFDVEFSDDPSDFWQMGVSSVPVIASLHKVRETLPELFEFFRFRMVFLQIGPVFLVDVTKEELMTADASVVIAADGNRNIFYQNTDWGGSEFGFELNVLEEILQVPKTSKYFSVSFWPCFHSASIQCTHPVHPSSAPIQSTHPVHPFSALKVQNLKSCPCTI